MFVEDSESHLVWFSGVQTELLSFKLVGMLCALAIYNSVLVDFPFPLALYKKILRIPLELEDLAELSPAEGRLVRFSQPIFCRKLSRFCMFCKTIQGHKKTM